MHELSCWYIRIYIRLLAQVEFPSRETNKIHYKRHLRKILTKSEKVSVKSGAVLATINVEFHVKYELPEFLNQALDNFFMFLFSISSMLESNRCQRKQKVVDKIIY